MPAPIVGQRYSIPNQNQEGSSADSGRNNSTTTGQQDRELVSERLAPLRDFVEVMNSVSQIAHDPNASAEDKKVCRQMLREFRNCCGQYAVAAVCQAYGSPVAIREVIRDTNPCGIGTGGKEIVDYLRGRGIVAAACERGTIDTLRGHVEQGGLAIVLVNADSDPSKFSPHWIVVGRSAQPETAAESAREYAFTVSDAADLTGSSTGVGTITGAALEQAWQKPFGRLSGPLLPQDHYWIAVDRIPAGQARSVPTRVSDASIALLDALIETPGNTLRESKELLGRIRGTLQRNQ